MGGHCLTPFLVEKKEEPAWTSTSPPQLEVRYYSLRTEMFPAVTDETLRRVARWPTSLAEAWPLYQCLVTTPPTDSLVLYLDCKAVMDLYDKLVLGPLLTDVQWLHISDRWLWEGFIIPLARQRLEQRSTIVLRHVRSHVRVKRITQKSGLTWGNETVDHYAGIGCREGIPVNLDPFIEAGGTALGRSGGTYVLSAGNAATRERPARIVKDVLANRRCQALVPLATGLYFNLHGDMDIPASQGALETRWVSQVRYPMFLLVFSIHSTLLIGSDLDIYPLSRV